MTLLKQITLNSLIISSLFYSAYASALDDGIKKMITEATGITDEDAAIASKKKEINLFEAYSLAVKNTEKLPIEGENSLQSEAKKGQAFGAFLPKVYLRANRYWADNYVFKSNSMRTTVSLYARQPIMTGLDEYSGYKSALSDVKIKKYNLYNNAVQLLFDVSVSFYNVIQIEKTIKNSEEVLNLYKKTINELNRRVAIGRSRKNEVERTTSELFKLDADIKALYNGLSHARLLFKTLTGATGDIRLIENNEFPDSGYKLDNTKDIVESRWDFKAAAEAVDLAKSRVISAYGGNLPSIYIDGTYLLYYDKNGANTQGTTRDYYFSLGAELPLFSGGIAYYKVKEALSLKRQSQLNLSRTIRLAEQDIIDSYQTWESSLNEVDAYKKALISAEENYKLINTEYKLNLVTILDVITSLKSLQSARNDYESSVLQHKLNRLRLGIAVNELSGRNIRLLK